MPLDENASAAIETICARLTERSATLFLGAGINALIQNDDALAFPLGDGLSNLICRDLLDDADLNLPLDESAEIARHRMGSKVVNDYIYKLFKTFKPGLAHLAIAQLPWDTIYTTNYDLLLEDAYGSPVITPEGVLRPVYSHDTDLTGFTEEDVLYYKLHGSMDVANTPEGRLVLTKDDYRYYDAYRKPLFKRLAEDLLNRTIVLIGYSLRDANFRAILDDCRQTLGAEVLPLSFAVTRSFKPLEADFWREKYNIQLIASDSVEFLTALRDTWRVQYNRVLPLEERKGREHLQVDATTRFQKVTDAFYLVRPEDCTGKSEAIRFFRGGEPSWNDIRDKVPPERDLLYTVFDAIFDELSNPKSAPAAYLVTGSAGTGKTTLLYSIGYAVADEFKLPVLVHVPGTPLDVRSIAPLVSTSNPQRIVIIVRHAAEVVKSLARFMAEAKLKKLPVTVLMEERKNQWLVATGSTREVPPHTEFVLGALSIEEIERILDALDKHGALEKLTGSPRDYQIEHFLKLAEQDLLVALRELTSDSKFDLIIADEFKKIPSEKARRAYVYVSALGQIDLPIRYATLNSLLDLTWEELRREIFLPAEGVLISLEDSGSSRHTRGFRLRARHPVIASIIFALSAPTDEAKFEIINAILSRLDPGYPEDARVLNDIVRGHKLVETLAAPEKRRGVYERLATILPNNPFVFQHRSILERDLGDSEASVRFARQAARLNSQNATIMNTLGMALEFAARKSEHALPRQSNLSEASLIFTEQLKRNKADAFSYLGLAYVKKQYRDMEPSADKRQILQAEILSLLDEAKDATGEHPAIMSELAVQQKQMGDYGDAMNVLKAGLERRPEEERLRDMLITMHRRGRNQDEAMRLAVEGTKYHPTSWRLQRHIARLKREKGEPVDAVKGHYEGAVRHRKGDLTLLVELGAYLFTAGHEADSRKVFNDAQMLPISGAEKSIDREWWMDGPRRRVFTGFLESIYAANGTVVAVPDNFKVFFSRTDHLTGSLRVRDEVEFYVGFNARGPFARIFKQIARRK